MPGRREDCLSFAGMKLADRLGSRCWISGQVYLFPRSCGAGICDNIISAFYLRHGVVFVHVNTICRNCNDVNVIDVTSRLSPRARITP